MMRERALWIAATLGLVLAFLAGCGGYGRLVKEPVDETNSTLRKLVENSDRYDNHFMVWPADIPIAVIFDPKDDDRKLVSDAWSPIKDKAELERVLTRLNTWYDPRMHDIMGPDKQLYGYFYSPRSDVFIKAMDEKTLRVYDYEAPGPGGP
jgi:isochorismate hydrolase